MHASSSTISRLLVAGQTRFRCGSANGDFNPR
jgi:hypothetical protein